MTGWESLSRAIQDDVDKHNVMVLINCGGNRALLELETPPNMKVFIIDSLRPFDLDNVSSYQVNFFFFFF